MALLFAGVLGVFAALAYGEVRTALLGVAETRLLSSGDRLGALLAQGPANQSSALADMAGRATVLSAVRGGGPSPGLAELLDSLDAAASSAGVILRGPDGVVAASNDSVLVRFADTFREASVGEMVQVGELLSYSLGAPVVSEGDTLGWIQNIRVIESNPASADVISGLVGQNATFLLGNARGGPWTDLAGLVDGPPPGTEFGSVEAWTRGDGEPMLGILTPVPGTPWGGWVALPEATILGPLRTLLVRMAGATALLVLVGAAGSWALGRWITGPLGELTAAAEGMAHGDYSRRIRSQRHDEVGRLGAAFDTMADEVEESRDRLEHRVAERTMELETTLAELRDAQEELVRKERLALLGELAGGVGHELRNPLGVMTNAVFYLKAVLADRPANVDEYLGILSEQIHISEKIVGDLLDFARIKPPQRQATDLARLAEIQLGRASVPESVRVEREFPAGMPRASVDPDQVAQIVLNLVVNAIQAMDETGGGTLTFRGRAEEGAVTLEVEDTGPGIPDGVLSKVFEPLFTTKAKGIGLGLSVSRSLAEANEGRLAVRTRPGNGTTFSLSFPVHAAS